MKVFVVLNDEGFVFASMEALHDGAGELVIFEGYDGPFDVAEGFPNEQHLYRLTGGNLVLDEARKSALMADAENAERMQEALEAAQATLQRMQVAALARSASDEDALLLTPLIKEFAPGERVEPGDVRRFKGLLYRVKDGQGHTTQANWAPDLTPALWGRVGEAGDEWPPWTPGSWDQWAKVTHKGKRWVSQVANNIWEPGAPGVYDNVWKEFVG